MPAWMSVLGSVILIGEVERVVPLWKYVDGLSALMKSDFLPLHGLNTFIAVTQSQTRVIGSTLRYRKLVQQPEGVTLQKYPQTRLLMILVEEVV